MHELQLHENSGQQSQICQHQYTIPGLPIGMLCDGHDYMVGSWMEQLDQ